jgi:hypothetical protein
LWLGVCQLLLWVLVASPNGVPAPAQHTTHRTRCQLRVLNVAYANWLYAAGSRGICLSM